MHGSRVMMGVIGLLDTRYWMLEMTGIRPKVHGSRVIMGVI